MPLSNAAGEYSSRAAEAPPFATGRVHFSKPHSMAAVGQMFFATSSQNTSEFESWLGKHCRCSGELNSVALASDSKLTIIKRIFNSRLGGGESLTS